MTPDESTTRCFSLLLICTGNICRSPAAERLVAASMGASVETRSAGTGALVGQPMAAGMAALLQQSRVQSDRFGARQVTERHIRDADLVLAMTRDHRAAVVNLWPGAVRRSFTLREFARLLSSVDADELPVGDSAARLRAAIPLAAAQRRHVTLASDIDDVADPYRRADEHYAAAFQQIHDAVTTIAQAINPAEDRSFARGHLPRRLTQPAGR